MTETRSSVQADHAPPASDAPAPPRKPQIISDPSVPRDEIHLRDDSGKLLGKIVNVDLAASPAQEATPPRYCVGGSIARFTRPVAPTYHCGDPACVCMGARAAPTPAASAPEPDKRGAVCIVCGQWFEDSTTHRFPGVGPFHVGCAGSVPPAPAPEPMGGLSVICRQCGTLTAGVEAGDRVRWVTCQVCADHAATVAALTAERDARQQQKQEG